MSTDSDSFRRVVQTGLSRGRWGALRSWVVSQGPEPFEDDVIDVLLEFIGQQSFRQAPHSHHVLVILQFEWDRLTTEHRKKILPHLVNAYARFEDMMSCYVISELLGRFYADHSALSALRELMTVESEGARSLIPMGLGFLARESPDVETAMRAQNELRKMRSDKSDLVRYEVETALSSVSNQAAPG